MSRLLDHFERIAIISLPQREDRRSRLMNNLAQTDLATPEDLTWMEAVDGRNESIPSWWDAGVGAWGCRLSHLNVLRQARKDQLENILILEDDVVFHPRAAQWLEAVMEVLPSDWGQFFLGGQYSDTPKATASPLLVESNGIVRTHAYAVHHSLYSQLIAVIENEVEYQNNPGWHIDHQFSWHHQEGHWKTYAPSWWIAGQEEGDTDIAKGRLSRRWWQHGFHFWKLPFVQVPATIPKQRELVFTEAPDSRDPFDLAHWFRRAAFEAWSQGRLPGIPNNLFSTTEIRRYWPAGTRDVTDINLSSLADYPANGLFNHPFSQIEKEHQQ